MRESIITREGLQRLSEELDRLKTEGRQAITERLRRLAESESNRHESAEFMDVRTEDAMLERKIAVLEERLRSAMLVEPQLGNGRVDVGERVRVRDLATGRRFELELVGPLEADPSAGRISIASPLGRAIVGVRRGEIVDVEAPHGPRQYKVLAVEPAARAGSTRAGSRTA
jgi:transcription elongation factor GreA